MEMKPIHLPPTKVYSLDALRVNDPDAWEGVQRLLASLQQELFESEVAQQLVGDLEKLLDGGFLYPEVLVDEDSQDTKVRFKMWPYLSNHYKYIEDMEDDEFDVVNGMLEYFARTN
jgi:hypothetical protein